LVTFSAEYVEYASELGTQIARVTTATIAERINTFSFVMSLSPRFGGRASTSLTLIQQPGDVPPGVRKYLVQAASRARCCGSALPDRECADRQTGLRCFPHS
jgi:hypothetical protein